MVGPSTPTPYIGSLTARCPMYRELTRASSERIVERNEEASA
jgi:hypothetical protein